MTTQGGTAGGTDAGTAGAAPGGAGGSVAAGMPQLDKAQVGAAISMHASRRSWRRLLAAALASIALICAWVFVLNPTGYCYAEKRHLSDNDFIVTAISMLVHGSKNTQGSHDQYQTAEQFMQLNPECCSLLRGGGTMSFEVEVIVNYRERLTMQTPSTGQNRGQPPVFLRSRRPRSGCHSAQAGLAMKGYV